MSNRITDSYTTKQLVYHNIYEERSAIAYRPKWAVILKDINAAILLQQVFYRWHHNKNKAFYKFKEPCKHEKYRFGDSWLEEMGFSKRNFDSALKKIGAKKSDSDKFPNALVYYRTDMNRLTWYEINDNAFCDFLHTVLQKSELDDLRKEQNGIYVDSESESKYAAKCDFVYNKEYIKEYLYKEENSEKESTPIKQVEPIQQEEKESSSVSLLSKDDKWYNWKTDVEKFNTLVEKHFDYFNVRRGMAEYSNRGYIKSMLVSVDEDYPLQLEAYIKGKEEGLFIEGYKLQGWLSDGWSSCLWTERYKKLLKQKQAKEKKREENAQKYSFRNTNNPTTIAPPKKPVNGFAIQ